MVENFTDLTGRIAVVIGGTSGLGRAIALGVARAGANVVPSGRRDQNVEEVCAEIEKLGRQTLRRTVDVTDRKSIDALRDKVQQHLRHVDVLVNAAGRTARRPTLEVNEEEWEAILDTNLTGMLRACQSFYEPLKESGCG